MTFHTPQNMGPREQQPFSLLFTQPPSKTPTDGLKQRTPPAAPFSGAGGAHPFSAREQTPPSRRRSLTPASSVAKDTPPPPPGDSLMDSPGLAGPSFAGWAGQPEPKPSIDQMAASPLGGAQPQAQPAATAAAAAARDYALAGRALREHDSTWVTVFGFVQADVPLVLREFGKCGDIEQFGTFEDGPHVNWLHISYASKHAAQRALLRSGEQLSAACMVGVKPLGPAKREAIERQLGGGRGAAAASASAALPKLASARPYQVNSVASQATMVPLASKGAWEVVSEFILGI